MATKKELLERIQQLESDLKTVCLEPLSYEATTIKFRYQVVKDNQILNDYFWNKPITYKSKFDGVLSKISGGVSHVYNVKKSDLAHIENGTEPGYSITFDLDQSTYPNLLTKEVMENIAENSFVAFLDIE